MNFPQTLIEGIFIKRYKRFLADIQLKNGNIITAHCPNTGSMKTCLHPSWPVLLSYNNNPKRKLAYTLELIHNNSCWICINTHRANQIVYEALQKNHIKELCGYTRIRKEVKYGKNSRIDLLLEKNDSPPCYVEVKSVTLLGENRHYLFPDSITNRGQKHLQALQTEKQQGNRSVLLFLIQRSDGTIFSPAWKIDPLYSQLLQQANASGVEILPYETEITPQKISLKKQIQFVLKNPFE